MGSIGDAVQMGRLGWIRHIEMMDPDNWGRKYRKIDIPSPRRRGRHKKAWDEAKRGDLTAKRLRKDLVLDRPR